MSPHRLTRPNTHPLDPPISLHVHIAPSTQLRLEGSGVSWRSRRWWPDKSSRAAGQVFEPDRPHKSLHVLGWCPETKTLITGLKAARTSDMPSKPICHTSLRFRSNLRQTSLLDGPDVLDRLEESRVLGRCQRFSRPSPSSARPSSRTHATCGDASTEPSVARRLPPTYHP